MAFAIFSTRDREKAFGKLPRRLVFAVFGGDPVIQLRKLFR